MKKFTAFAVIIMLICGISVASAVETEFYFYPSDAETYYVTPGEMLSWNVGVRIITPANGEIVTADYTLSWSEQLMGLLNPMMPSHLSQMGTYFETHGENFSSFLWVDTDEPNHQGGIWLGGADILNSTPVGSESTLYGSLHLWAYTETDSGWPESIPMSFTKHIHSVDGIRGDFNGDNMVTTEDADSTSYYLYYRNIFSMVSYTGYMLEGNNLGRARVLFPWPTQLDAYLIDLWIGNPDHWRVEGLGIGELYSQTSSQIIQRPYTYEIQGNQQLAISTEGEAVSAYAVLYDGTVWENAQFNDGDHVVFNLPEGVDPSTIKISSVDTPANAMAAEDPVAIASKYKLEQNYPNPFNPSTTISYETPQAGPVNLSIYNINGQLVAELFSGQQTAGKHHINFDGANLPSGAYFYRLTAGDFVTTKKMVLMK